MPLPERRMPTKLIEHARNLGPSPTLSDASAVRCRGESLSEPIYWLSRQWAVTEYGIEARDGTYHIANERLWENEAEYPWVQHMDKKDWVDIADFAEALRVAPRLLSPKGRHDAHSPHRPRRARHRMVSQMVDAHRVAVEPIHRNPCP